MEFPPWSELPALAICKVYNRLSLKDVLSASSTCIGWRLSLALYNGKRNDLPLHTSEEDENKNMFLISLFGVKTESVSIILNSNLPFDYVKFSYEIWPRVCELRHLKRLSFVASLPYLEYEKDYEGDLLRRLFLYPLLVDCARKFRDITFKGCGNIAKKFLNNLLKINGTLQKLEFTSLRKKLPSDIIDCTLLQNIAELSLDYDCLNEESLKAIVDLRTLDKLALHVRRPVHEDLTHCWNFRTLRNPKVYLHCVLLTPETLGFVKSLILSESLNLVAIRVLFCKSLDTDLLRHLSNYSQTLKEVTWIDVPINASPINVELPDMRKRRRIYMPRNQATPNPIVMVSWRCVNLEKLTIQGYYHSCNDLLGIARLRGDNLKVLNVPHLIADEDENFCRDPEPFQPAILNSPCLYVPPEELERISKCLWNIPNWPDNVGTNNLFNVRTTDESEIFKFLTGYPSF